MKKIYLVIVVLLLSIVPVHARDSKINNLTIDCLIDSEGTAIIEETIDIDAYEGTEYYQIFSSMNEKELTLTSVKEGSTTFENVGTWDSSRSTKKNKCGTVYKSNGYELCFGIGDHGHHTFVMVYKIDHFIDKYEDTQGINYAFFSQMALPVEKATVDIHIADYTLENENSDIWAFGYEGSVNYKDGHIIMTSNDTIDGGRMQLLSRMTYEFTSPNTYWEDRSFEDVLDEAKEGSSYDDYDDDDSFFDTFFAILFSVFSLGAGIFAFVIAIVKKGSTGGGLLGNKLIFSDGQELNVKDAHPFIEIPTKNIFYAYFLIDKMNTFSDSTINSGLISALVLKWLRSGQIDFQRGEDKGIIFKKKTYFIDFSKPLDASHESEDKLYRYFVQASGSNKILETKEFERWCSKHYEKILNWFDKANSYTRQMLIAQGLIQVQTIEHKVLGITFHTKKDIYDPKVREDAQHIYGLYKFLVDQNNMKEKQVLEVHLWDEYLMYASIFGIADQVEKQLEIVQPTFYNENQDLFTSYYITNSFVHSGYSRAVSASSSESGGGGGSSSFGGGGGSFSGGGGGGLR